MHKCWLLSFLSLLASARPSMPVDSAADLERTVDIGGTALYLRCVGERAPTVVIDAGAGHWSIHYRHIQDRLRTEARVCAYDRAGLGRSEPAVGGRTPSMLADELARLLRAAAIEPPYVLVGHSLGGLNVRAFERRHPTEVAALVLLDATHPEQWQRLPPSVLRIVRASSLGLRALADRAEDAPLDPSLLPAWPSGLDPDLRAEYETAASSPTTLRTHAAELEGSEHARHQVPAAELGTLPLVVVSAGDSFAEFEPIGIPVAESNVVWERLQHELALLSRDTVQLVSPRATHSLHESDPEIVVLAIRIALDRARGGSDAEPSRP